MSGAELRMAPTQALQSFALINGRMSLWGDSLPALLLSNGFKLREWMENPDPSYPDNMTARCEIIRPDGQVFVGEFSVADAKEAKLWSKDGPWQTAKKRMMKMRARAFTCRDGAADLLRGLYVAEEAEDIAPLPPEEQTGGTGMVARLAARAQPVDPEGFNVNQVTAETAAAKPKRAAKAKPDTSVGEPAPSAEPDKDTSASATDASTDSQVDASGPIASSEPTSASEQEAEFEDASATEPTGPRHAAPGEAYLLEGEPEGTDGNWTLYKDGQGFSRVGTKGFENFPRFPEHARRRRRRIGRRPSMATICPRACAPGPTSRRSGPTRRIATNRRETLGQHPAACSTNCAR